MKSNSIFIEYEPLDPEMTKELKTWLLSWLRIHQIDLVTLETGWENEPEIDWISEENC